MLHYIQSAGDMSINFEISALCAVPAAGREREASRESLHKPCRRKLPWQPAGVAKAVPAEVFQQNLPVLRSTLLKSEAMAAVESI